ncbi:Uncharacterised protein [Vibrio cholerae]|nr:Uncharacterised protein [Vibrio cholerae]CSI83889.1 Uncharacterised protein [Vibrio cholerae]
MPLSKLVTPGCEPEMPKRCAIAGLRKSQSISKVFSICANDKAKFRLDVVFPSPGRQDVSITTC